MPSLRLALSAMATRFEIVLHGDKPASLRAAAEEALEEIERLEAQLSLFRPSSEIAHLNARAAKEPVRVSPALFALLQRARKLSEEAAGAFDITIAPLVRCWGFRDGTGHLPDPAALAAVRATVGMSLVQLDPGNLTVRFLRAGVLLDLGAIGKGYAVERAAEILREAGVTSALIHGGTSTVEAIGHPPDAETWKIAVATPLGAPASPPAKSALPVANFDAVKNPSPESDVGRPTILPLPGGEGWGEGERASNETAPLRFPAPHSSRENLLATVELKDEAMSVSGIHGKFFQAEGRTFGHILDPRTGEPANRAVLAVVVLPSATETDALSTALLTLGPEGHEKISSLRRGMRTLVAAEANGRLQVEAQGIRCETGVE